MNRYHLLVVNAYLQTGIGLVCSVAQATGAIKTADYHDWMAHRAPSLDAIKVEIGTRRA